MPEGELEIAKYVWCDENIGIKTREIWRNDNDLSTNFRKEGFEKWKFEKMRGPSGVAAVKSSGSVEFTYVSQEIASYCV